MLYKQDIIDRIVQKGYTKTDANTIIDVCTRVITEALVEGESVRLVGFGTFSVSDSPSRKMIDYQTKQEVIIPAYKSPKFLAGKFLKRAVKEGFVRE